VLAWCRHCRIPFLTAACNRRRKDLLCPFGCRELHQQRQSEQRSRDYYRSDQGKERKRNLNRNRYLKSAAVSKKQNQSLLSAKGSLILWRISFLRYIRFLMGVLQHQSLSLDQTRAILDAVVKKGRQHSLDFFVSSVKVSARGP